MPPKRQVAHKAGKAADSHAASTDFESNVHPASKRQRVEELFDDEDTLDASHPLRRSSRAGKGSGGQLQQLHQLERVQLARHSRPSSRELEMATQGHEVNPMAPSYEPSQDDGEESEVGTWIESSAPAIQAKPSFAHAQPGDQFGFRLPKQTTTSACDPEAGIIRNRPRVRPSSMASSGESQRLSRGSSMFSGALSHGTSTAATSRAPSECESNIDQDVNTLDRTIQAAEEVLRRPRRATQMRRIQSFSQVPSSLSGENTPFDSEAEVPRSVKGTDEIDEVSPSEDERFAESNLWVPVSNTQRFQDRVATNTDEEYPTSTTVAPFRRDQSSRSASRLSAARSGDQAQIYEDNEQLDSGFATRARLDQSSGSASRSSAARSGDQAQMNEDDEQLDAGIATRARRGQTDEEYPTSTTVAPSRRDQSSRSASRLSAARSGDQAQIYEDNEQLDSGFATRARRDQSSGSAPRSSAARSRDQAHMNEDNEQLDAGIATRARRGQTSAQVSRRGIGQAQNCDRTTNTGIEGTVPTRDDDEHPASSITSATRHSTVSHSLGVTEDVVTQHRQRNRAPRLPSNTSLRAVHEEQQVQRSRRVSRNSSVSNDRDGFDASMRASAQPPSTDPLPSTDTQFMSPANTNPSQLHFYPPAFRDIIERAKQFSHCDLGSINSFPMRPQFTAKATDYMNEAIAERRARGLPIPTGWWPNHSDHISKLLWEDIGNWRSALKKRARTFTRERYEWDPQNRRSVNADIAKTLLNGGAFLKDGLDEDGRTNNLAHPALSGVVVDFFYTGQVSIGNLFPEVFATEVPRPAVALAATAIKVALDEIGSDGKDVAFKRDVYADVYADILGLMAKCDTSPIHRAKTGALRKQWAKIGSNSNGNVTGTSTGFDVDLD